MTHRRKSLLLSLLHHADIIKVVLGALGVKYEYSMPACTRPVKCYTGASCTKQSLYAESKGAESKLRYIETMLPLRSVRQSTQVQLLVSWLAFCT